MKQKQHCEPILQLKIIDLFPYQQAAFDTIVEICAFLSLQKRFHIVCIYLLFLANTIFWDWTVSVYQVVITQLRVYGAFSIFLLSGP